MALILKEKEFSNGLVLNNVYCKILDLACNKDTINYRVGFYANKELRVENKQVIEVENFSCNHDVSNIAKNSLKQAYEHLKSVNGYEEAIDDFTENE